VEIKGPKGAAYIGRGEGHDWVLEFYPKASRKHPRKIVKRTFKNNGARAAAIVVAKQLTGAFDQEKKR
jgi:hypothetical protein